MVQWKACVWSQRPDDEGADMHVLRLAYLLPDGVQVRQECARRG